MPRSSKVLCDLLGNMKEYSKNIFPSSPNIVGRRERRRSQEIDIPEIERKLENIQNHVTLSLALLNIVLPPVKE